MKYSKRLVTVEAALCTTIQSPCRFTQRRLISQARPFTPFGTRQPVSSAEAAVGLRSEPRHAQLIPGLQKKLAGYTLNEDIKSGWVQTRTPDGKLAEPQLLETILRQINPASQAVRLLAVQGPLPDTAIVEVQEIDDLLKMASARDQAMKEVEKQRKEQKVKQLELNWAISDNDLALKLKQLEQFLTKGKRVEVLLAAKKRQRKATEEEAAAVVKKLEDTVEECGAKQIKMEGNLLGQAMFTFQKK